MRQKSGAQNLTITRTKCNNIACHKTQVLLYVQRLLKHKNYERNIREKNIKIKKN